MQTATLPKDWSTILDGVSDQLHGSLAEVDQRIAKLSPPRKGAPRDRYA